MQKYLRKPGMYLAFAAFFLLICFTLAMVSLTEVAKLSIFVAVKFACWIMFHTHARSEDIRKYLTFSVE